MAEGPEALAFAEHSLDRLLRIARVADAAHNLAVIRAAARSEHADVPAGHGVQQFLELCLNAPTTLRVNTISAPVPRTPFECFRATSAGGPRA